jgi:hypothetical protein
MADQTLARVIRSAIGREGTTDHRTPHNRVPWRLHGAPETAV